MCGEEGVKESCIVFFGRFKKVPFILCQPYETVINSTECHTSKVFHLFLLFILGIKYTSNEIKSNEEVHTI